MTCPYCGGEMRAGTMLADSRARLGWYPEDEKPGKADLFIGFYPRITAAEYGFAYWRLKSDYCPNCKKMIFTTDIQS